MSPRQGKSSERAGESQSPLTASAGHGKTTDSDSAGERRAREPQGGETTDTVVVVHQADVIGRRNVVDQRDHLVADTFDSMLPGPAVE